MSVTLVTAFLAIAAALEFDPSGGTQFEQSHAWVRDIGLTYHVGMDGLSLVLVALTAVCVPCALAFGLWARRSNMRAYAALMLLLESAVVLLLVARDLGLFYVGFETMLVPLAFLIAVWGGPNRARATIRFIIYTLVGSLLMLVAVITLGLQAGSFDLDEVGTSDSRWLFLAFMAAFAIKSPLYPFHGWVRDAYRESPPEVAALLSGVVSKAGVYGMLRFALPLFPEPAHDLRRWFVAIAVIGLLWCSLMAFRQPDTRGVIAYSSISQMSLIGLGIFVMNDIGATGRDVPDGQPRPALGAAVPDRRRRRGAHRRRALPPHRRARARPRRALDGRHDERHRDARGARLGALRLRVPRAPGRVPRLVADRRAGLARDRALGHVHAALDLGDPARRAARAVGRDLEDAATCAGRPCTSCRSWPACWRSRSTRTPSRTASPTRSTASSRP